MWIYLSALSSTFGLTPDHPLITDEEYIINRAIRKPELKVSTFKATADATEI
jgi:cation-transporting ATPase 13A3/4/5